eukprot:TRINITY_DN11169_c0_g2_i1.p1 TRINITY_DN11169_c0_g2~~TRINITY_DN11169_c0_g2_i1.p1  ORF type:complete len:218 (+),score=32.14 TRINITY_DN11169_c0_g2_i1:72-725(+)
MGCGASAEKKYGKLSKSEAGEEVFRTIGTGRGECDLEKLANILRIKPGCSNSYRQRYGQQNTALHLAAFNGNTEAVKLLLADGADPTIRAASGMTPAQYAKSEGHRDVAKLIEEWDAEAVFRAVGNHSGEGDLEKLANLLRIKPGSSNGFIQQGWEANTALLLAAYYGKTETVKLLLADGADTTVRSSTGLTPAQLAEKQGHHDVAKLIESLCRSSD